MKSCLFLVLAVCCRTATAAPPNDAFANRLSLTEPLPLTVTADAAGCSYEPLEPHRPAGFQPRVLPLGGSVWWSWTAPNDGWVEIDPASSAASPEREAVAFIGSTLSSLVPVPNARWVRPGFRDQRLHFPTIAGQTYQIAICLRDDAVDSSIAHFSMRNVAAPSTNDRFSSRAILPSAGSVVVSASNQTATLDADDAPWRESADEDASLWWEWVCPASGSYRLAAVGPEVLTLRVLEGADATSLSMVPLAQGFLSAVSGRTYYLRVAAETSGFGGPFELEIQEADGGSDARAGAQFAPGTLPVAASGATRGKSVELGERGSPGYSRSVWWKWTSPQSTTVTLDLRTLSGVALAELVDGNTLTVVPAKVLDWKPASGKAPVQYDVVNGKEYYVRVAANLDLWFQWSLSLASSAPAAPANDDFANAVDLGIASRVFVPLSALRYSAEPGGGATPANESLLWWRWTAPASGDWLVSSKVQVYSGSQVTSLTRLTLGASSVLGVTAGQSLYLAVGPNAGVGWGMRPLEWLPNDDFANALDLGAVTEVRKYYRGTAGSSEVGEPEPFLPEHLSSYWWKWTAPASGLVRFGTNLSRTLAEVAAFTGSSLDALQPAAESTRMESGATQTVAFSVTAGQLIYLRVSLSAGGTPSFAIDLRPFAAAPNPTVGTATNLGNGITAMNVSTFRGAGLFTPIPGDPARLVWWKWTAPADGVLSVAGDGDDSQVDVPCCQARGFLLSPSLALVPVAETNHPIDDYHSLYHVAAGSTYYFCLRGGVDAEQVRIRTELWSRQELVNDDFSAATIIPSGQGFVESGSAPEMNRLEFSYQGGTVEAGEPSAADSARSSLWWRWTPAQTRNVVAYAWRKSEPPGQYFPRAITLEAFTGSDVNSLTPVANNSGAEVPVGSDAEAPELYFSAQAGVTYHLRVRNPYELQLGDTLPAAPVSPALLCGIGLRIQDLEPAAALAAYYGLDPVGNGAPLAQLDGEELPNLLKYAFGLDPRAQGGRRPELIYQSSLDQTGLSWQAGPLPIPLPGWMLLVTPEYSPDLLEWASPDEPVEITQELQVQFTPLLRLGYGRFLRLQADFVPAP